MGIKGHMGFKGWQLYIISIKDYTYKWFRIIRIKCYKVRVSSYRVYGLHKLMERVCMHKQVIG